MLGMFCQDLYRKSVVHKCTKDKNLLKFITLVACYHSCCLADHFSNVQVTLLFLILDDPLTETYLFDVTL